MKVTHGLGCEIPCLGLDSKVLFASLSQSRVDIFGRWNIHKTLVTYPIIVLVVALKRFYFFYASSSCLRNHHYYIYDFTLFCLLCSVMQQWTNEWMNEWMIDWWLTVDQRNCTPGVKPGICHPMASCTPVTPHVCSATRAVSYECECNQGYTGDGFTCAGELQLVVKMQ